MISLQLVFLNFEYIFQKLSNHDQYFLDNNMVPKYFAYTILQGQEALLAVLVVFLSHTTVGINSETFSSWRSYGGISANKCGMVGLYSLIVTRYIVIIFNVNKVAIKGNVHEIAIHK